MPIIIGMNRHFGYEYLPRDMINNAADWRIAADFAETLRFSSELDGFHGDLVAPCTEWEYTECDCNPKIAWYFRAAEVWHQHKSRSGVSSKLKAPGLDGLIAGIG